MMKPSKLFILKDLASRSALFEVGALEDALDDASFMRRLNALVISHRWSAKGFKSPACIADAVKADGRIHSDAELLAFGQWLIAEGAPGLTQRGGPAPNAHTLMRTLGAALAEVLTRDRWKKQGGATKPATTTGLLSKTVLAARWTKMFAEGAKASDFDSRIRSLKRVLPAYLEYIAKGQFQVAGRVATKSSMIRRIDKLLQAKSSAKASATSPALAASPKGIAGAGGVVAKQTPVEAADLVSFGCVLRYSSMDCEKEYRQRLPGALPVSSLTYRTERYAQAQTASAPKVGRDNHLVMVPDLDIARYFRITALIDRMAVLLSTQHATTGRQISSLLTGHGIIGFVRDRKFIPRNVDGWEAKLPPLDLAKPTGHHFAVLIQEPTRKTLTAALKSIDQAWGITGQVTPFLCELALDFHPDKDRTTTADERVVLRERIVGALQRHHWCRADKLISDAVPVPRYVDARQEYQGAGKAGSSTSYLFASKQMDKFNSDMAVNEPVVQHRILKATEHDGLLLNATMYRGARDGDVLVRIQHKISDRWNPAMKTSISLREHERRARIEVQITGQKALAGLGLTEVADLSRLNFRALKKDLLVFRVPLIEAFKEELAEAQAQMNLRGIYGWELRKLASAAHEKDVARIKGQPQGKATRRKAVHLASWLELNTDVGHALDALGKRWRKFVWTSNQGTTKAGSS